MKKFIAIGHFDDSKNMTSVAMNATSMKSFRENCGGNGFIPYVVISEQKFEKLASLTETWDIWMEVRKLTTNYRKWSELTEYIAQCLDIMEEKMANA